MRYFTSIALTASLITALSACGGSSGSSNDGEPNNNENNNGGGNSSDFTPVSINAENADDVAGMAISLLDLGISSPAATDSARTTNHTKSTLLTKAELFSAPCEEGGSSIFNGGDGDLVIEVGDYFEIVEDNCATQEFDEDTNESYIDTSNGSLRIDVARVTNQLDIGYNVTIDQSFSTSHGHNGSSKGSGTFNIKLDGNGGQTGSGNYNVVATYDGKSVTFDPMQYTIVSMDEEYSYDYNAEIYGSAIQGSVSLKTSPSFTGSVDDDYPTAGTLTITGSNSSISLNADTGSKDTVLMTITDNGSITSREVTWQSLEDPEPLQ